MVPPLSALSLALCHEALEGCGNHKMETFFLSHLNGKQDQVPPYRAIATHGQNCWNGLLAAQQAIPTILPMSRWTRHETIGRNQGLAAFFCFSGSGRRSLIERPSFCLPGVGGRFFGKSA